MLTIRHEQRNLRALLGMMVGLYALWIIAGGLLQRRFAPAARNWARTVPLPWRWTFFLACIAMAMAEEAITTLMTNLAPLFGVRVGEVYITASANYWDVILGHSLIVIAPTFLCWTWLIGRYAFEPLHALLLFGLTGTVMEMVYGGPGQAVQIGMWVFVYGLMIYLPAHIAPPDRPARPVRWKHYAMAVFLPFLFMPLCIPVLFGIRAIRPSAATEFPPIVLSK